MREALFIHMGKISHFNDIVLDARARLSKPDEHRIELQQSQEIVNLYAAFSDMAIDIPMERMGDIHGWFNVFPTLEDTKQAFLAFMQGYQGYGIFSSFAENKLFTERTYYYLIRLFSEAFQGELIYDPKITDAWPYIFKRAAPITKAEEEAEAERRQQAMPSPDYIRSHIDERRRAEGDFYGSLFQQGLHDSNPVILERKRKAEKLAREDIKKIKTFISEWAEFAELLYKEPLQDRSGQFEEKELSRRTFADMVEEMKHELVNLPRHTAYCKLAQEIQGVQVLEKYKLRPYRPWQAYSESEYQVWRNLIIERTQRQYCRPRTEVDEEIKARKAALTAPLRKTQTVRTEE